LLKPPLEVNLSFRFLSLSSTTSNGQTFTERLSNNKCFYGFGIIILIDKETKITPCQSTMPFQEIGGRHDLCQSEHYTIRRCAAY
jgi:hypothetical protein